MNSSKSIIIFPAKNVKGGLLVLHAWWGINPFIHELCQCLASNGYLTLAPDMFAGATASTIPEAKKLRSSIRQTVVMKTASDALSELELLPELKTKQVGVLGLSFGGYWALWLSDQPGYHVAATVYFYATRGGNYNVSQSAYLGHFAEHDDYVASSSVKKMERTMEKAGRDVQLFTYPDTKHWFFENDRPEYNSSAAQLAWDRTIEFLNKTLG